jgi:hypothetical protein
MPCSVTVAVPNTNGIGEPMKAMRTWLDGRKSHPISFRYSFELHQILFHVQFETAVEATEFEEAFKKAAA